MGGCKVLYTLKTVPNYVLQDDDHSDECDSYSSTASLRSLCSISSISPASLQSLCSISSIDNLEYYSPEMLACIPLTLRYQLLAHCPIVDICRLEKTSVFNDMDTKRVWSLLCDNIYKRARFECYDSTLFAKKKYDEMLRDGVSSREKCFLLLTTAILCAERPLGLFRDDYEILYTSDRMPQKWLKNYCPADIVNYLVCTDGLSEVKEKFQEDNQVSKRKYVVIPQKDSVSRFEPEGSSDGSGDDIFNDEDQVNTDLVSVAYNNQHFPPRYAHLLGEKNHVENEVAITLLMDGCEYYPTSITLHGFEFIDWSKSKEEVQDILTKFFFQLRELHLYLGVEHDEGYVCSMLTSCFKSCALSATFVTFCGDDLTNLVVSYLTLQHPEVNQLTLDKLRISKFDTPTSSRCKMLSEILACHSGLSELELNGLHVLEYPNVTTSDISNILQCVIAIVRNTSFSKLTLTNVHFTMKFAVELLTAFLVAPCSHSQELIMQGVGVSGDDPVLQPSIHFDSDDSDSALEFKSLVWTQDVSRREYHDMQAFCSWLLSF